MTTTTQTQPITTRRDTLEALRITRHEIQAVDTSGGKSREYQIAMDQIADLFRGVWKSGEDEGYLLDVLVDASEIRIDFARQNA